MPYKTIAKISVIASVALEFNKVLFTKTYIDILCILFGLIALSIAIAKKQIRINYPALRYVFLGIILILIAVICGSITTFIIDTAVPMRDIFLSYRMLAGCVILFLEIVLLGYTDKTFLKQVLFSFFTSLLVIVIAYLPERVRATVQENPHLFSGLVGNSNYYTPFMILPTMALLYFVVNKKISRYNGVYVVFLFILFSLSLNLIVYSGARSGWIGMAVSLTVFAILKIKKSGQKVRTFFLIIFLYVSAMVTGHMLLPTDSKANIQHRVAFISESVIPLSAANPIKNPVEDIVTSVSTGQDRLNIWKQAIPFIAKNPLGYGPSYQQIINLYSYGSHRGAHSFPLELLLTGGIVLFGVILGTIATLMKNFIFHQKRIQDVDLETVLVCSLIGSMCSMFFLDAFMLRWLWAECAILIAWQINRTATMRNL